MKYNIAIHKIVVLLVAALFGVNTAGAEGPIKVVTLGDSLMAGYQLPPGDAFPSRLDEALKAGGFDVQFTNASVSGDTSSGGLERLEWSVPEGTDIVIVELGANDALRGILPDITQQNLSDIITRLQARNIDVVLAGMLAPPNMGPEYEAAFNQIYPELAKTFDVPLYPFILDGVVTKPDLQLSDGMHPNALGVTRMVEGFLPFMEKVLTARNAGQRPTDDSDQASN